MISLLFKETESKLDLFIVSMSSQCSKFFPSLSDAGTCRSGNEVWNRWCRDCRTVAQT